MSYLMFATTRARFGAAIVAIAPAVMLAGLLAHPYIATLPDAAAVAEAATADTTYWGLVHLTAAVASGLLVLAFLAIRSYLREAGEDRWSILAIPFIVVGSTLFTVLPGMEFAPLATAEAGGDVQATQAALAPLFLPTLVTGESRGWRCSGRRCQIKGRFAAAPERSSSGSRVPAVVLPFMKT